MKIEVILEFEYRSRAAARHFASLSVCGYFVLVACWTHMLRMTSTDLERFA